jgi:hypothetical protein
LFTMTPPPSSSGRDFALAAMFTSVPTLPGAQNDTW